jgi:tetratricopeptide (TPR) repeat protein
VTSRSVAAALILLLGACGSTPKRTVDGPLETPKLPPVAPEALSSFDAALRALRLGGPEARDKARERLQNAVEIDPKLWEGWHDLGVVYFADGDDTQAAEAFGKALAINPAHLESRLARAEALRRAGRSDAARSDYQAVLERLPDHRDAAARLASLLREARKYEDAIDVIRDVLRNAGANARVYVQLGLIYRAQGRDELADLVLTKAAELDDKEPSIYNARALLALERDQAQRAFDLFDHATSLDPDYLDARYNKAAVLMDAGDYAGARDELKVVADKDPGDLRALVALGVAYRGTEEYDRARASWERVVKDAPRRSQLRGDALYNLAVLHMDFLEDEKEAMQALDRYLQNAPAKHPKRQNAEERKEELGL